MRNLMDAHRDTNVILRAAGEGDSSAHQELAQRLYGELHDIAARHLKAERPDHTLQATALVHEAWIRLLGSDKVTDADRNRFLAAASNAIRRVLIDHARKRNAAKRGAGAGKEALGDLAQEVSLDPIELLALDEALEGLRALKERHAQVVEMRYFGGLTFQQVGDVLGIAADTARDDWNAARAWLARQLREAGG